MGAIQLHRCVKICCTVVAALLLVSCSSKHYRASADKETAAVLAQKTPLVQNMDTNFTVEAQGKSALDDLPLFEKTEEYFGPDADLEMNARVISLEKALNLAVKQSHTYQNRKEDLYVRALRLTLERHEYAPLFSGRSRGRTSRSTTQVRGGVDQIVERDVTGDQNAGLRMLSRAGTRLATDFSTDFLRFITGDPRLTSSSALVGTLSQPLLRGSGARIAAERLTQAERSFLYSMRDFTRYRKEFSVDIASSYYNVLQNRDAVRNSWRGYQNFKANVERERAFAEVGLRARAQLEQLRQAELSAESKWINAVRVYRQSLDKFKIDIGLPVEADIVLDDSELNKLEVVDPQLALDEALEVALISRLDLETDRDELIDAERHISVAKNAFLPQLDAVGSANVSGNGRGGLSTPQWDRYRWNAGVDLDLPLNRKAQRNSYREAIIRHERAQRKLALAVDNIKLQLADDWRNLEQAKRNYEISEVGVAIAAGRVEEQDLRQKLGRGTARDMVDAQNDLIDSKNQRTSALVSHTVARLRFWRDIGILIIKENGEWDDVNRDDVVKQENEFSDN
ncbi:MAG: TolC family protein [Verrucomicrobia bacterium]|nr:TolC family protein [Verrucomicrobiota bacterium]